MDQNFKLPNKVFAEIAARRRQRLEGNPGLGQKYLQIRKESVANLDALLEKAVANLKAKRCQVHVVSNAAEAREIILGLVDTSPVVKARSLAMEEIEVVTALRGKGVEVVETTLGDFILQEVGGKAFHPILPACHQSEEEIACALQPGVGQADLKSALSAFRARLRSYLSEAKFGLTGANAVVADNGSLVIMEDEGNARAVSNLARTHVVVAGIEKIVPDQESAMTVCRTAAVYGTGRDIGNYVSIITGPSSTGDIQGKQVFGMHGPTNVVVILLDNGRRQCVYNGFEELLYCLNCGACLEVCPVFREKGPDYGGVYPGGRGAAFAAFIGGLENARKVVLGLCKGCGKCSQVCPAGIDTPNLIKKLLDQVAN